MGCRRKQDESLQDDFEKILEATYPNHAYPVRHMLKECTMMKNYVTTGALAKGKNPKDDSSQKVAVTFLEEKVVMSMYGGPAPYEPRRKLKLTSQPVNVESPATLEYHRWSESPITFVQMDHPDSIP
jgi:hypothetical protein